MKKELADRIIQKYPQFFQTKEKIYTGDSTTEILQNTLDLIKQKTIVEPIQFGFECEDGWAVLLDSMFYDIHQYTVSENEYRKTQVRWKFFQNKIFPIVFRVAYKWQFLLKPLYWVKNILPKGTDRVPPFFLTQVKEKYGDLRVYYGGGDDHIDGIVRAIESLSGSVCEYCGTTRNVGKTKGWIYTICEDCYRKNDRANKLEWNKINI